MKINVHCPIGSTGYGVASLNLIKELDKREHEVSLFNIGNPSVDNENDLNIIQKCLNRQKTFDYNSPTLKIWHQFDLATKPGNGKYYAYPFFELNLFNDSEKHHLNFPDHLIVSSNWAKEVIQSNNINKPTHIVNLGVDRTIFDSNNFSENTINDKYIFITIGKWEKRKSHDIIIELFNKAFELNDNVELWMVTNNPFLSKQDEQIWLDRVIDSKLRSKIKVFPRLESHLELARVINYSHCGIYISKAEGWNLELLETMSMGKPVIATNFSAHTEFCDKNNSYLVDISKLEDANDGIWFHGFGQWAHIGESEKDQIIEYMRNVYKNHTVSNPNGVETAKKFSWENSVDQLIRCIQN